MIKSLQEEAEEEKIEYGQDEDNDANNEDEGSGDDLEEHLEEQKNLML